jgi:Family of unknown function (DUF5996)
MRPSEGEREQAWPRLPLEAWSDTAATLHLWLQIVGKIRLIQSPWINHGWHVTLYVTGRGLTTSPMPYGSRSFEIELDFVGHQAVVRTSDGTHAKVPLQPQSVAEFYRRLMEALSGLGLSVRIRKRPCELPDPVVAFDQDQAHRAYDAEYAHRFWRVLVQADRVFRIFRARFIGKCSPVHLFWGAPDLAVTRFSGRTAPRHPGGVPNLPDRVTREAYSHEVSSCGFWAGGGPAPYPVFYAYAYPEPPGFAESKVGPAAAFYSGELREFLLPYDAVRESESPDDTLLEFLQTTYEAAANAARWDRAALERPPGWKP